MAEQQKSGEKTYWLDDRKNVDKIWYALIGICVFTVICDFFYHKHVEFAVEDIMPGMYGWYGLGGCLFLVLSAKILRQFVARDEDYYDAEDLNEVRDD